MDDIRATPVTRTLTTKRLIGVRGALPRRALKIGTKRLGGTKIRPSESHSGGRS
jgi:hypothetical protein